MFDNPVVVVLISAIIGFLLKYVWDRWFAQSSRVTKSEFNSALGAMRNECVLKRDNCLLERKANREYFETLIKQQSSFLEDSIEADAVTEKRRTQTRHVLLCILITQLKICDALNKIGEHAIDCDSISKMMVDLGVIE